MIKEQEIQFRATKIIDYPGFRQSTKYSCGACATQSALVYCMGSKYDLPETDFMKKLKTTESDGTDPESIIKFLKSKGVRLASGILSIASLKEAIDNNHPIIICIQAWGKQNNYENVYKEGHYVTVIGYNNDGFIIEDPSISARYGFIKYEDLDSRWHDVDKNGKKYDHFGIIIQCNKKYLPQKMEVIEGKQMKNIVDIYLNQIQEAGFEDKPKGWTDKSIEKYEKTFTKKMKGTAKSPKFFEKCVEKMQGKVDNPEGFCAALKDESHGSTYWRGKDKSPSEVSKDVKKHQNVNEGIGAESLFDLLFRLPDAINLIRNHWTKCKRACGRTYEDLSVKCRIECDLKATNSTIKSLEKAFMECKDQKCKQKYRKSIISAKKKRTKLQHKLKRAIAIIQQRKHEKRKEEDRKKWERQYDKNKKKLGESLTEDFLQSLYTDNRSQAKEWRGTNIPYGDDSNRPNLIRKCMTLESDRQKINCLRKLREQAAMNPFYQARIDRFVDAITDTYEPTKHQGTIPGNEFKRGNVGDDLGD